MALFKVFTYLLSICLAFEVTNGNVLTSNGNVSVQDTLQSYDWKPRVFILSDILNEPDDSMSLVRYLLYSNEFETKGLCATTSWWLKNMTHPEEMRTIVQAYGEVVDNLNQHVHPTAKYQTADDLLELVTTGPTVGFLLLHLLGGFFSCFLLFLRSFRRSVSSGRVMQTRQTTPDF